MTIEHMQQLLIDNVHSVQRCLRVADAEKRGALPAAVLAEQLRRALREPPALCAQLPPAADAALAEIVAAADVGGGDVELARLWRVLRGRHPRCGVPHALAPAARQRQYRSTQRHAGPASPGAGSGAAGRGDDDVMTSVLGNRRRLDGIDHGDRKLGLLIRNPRLRLGRRLRELDRPLTLLGDIAVEVPWAVYGDSEQSDNMIRGAMRERRERIRDATRAADAGDGRIPRRAFAAMVRQADKYVGQEEIIEMLDELDPNRRGWVSTSAFLAKYETHLLESKQVRPPRRDAAVGAKRGR